MAEFICISCPMGCMLAVAAAGGEITVSGHTCKRGEVYGRQEFSAPMRVVTSTASVEGGARPVVSVKTSRPVPKGRVNDVLREIAALNQPAPVAVGDVLLRDALGLGADIVATAAV